MKRNSHRYIANEIYMASFRMYLHMVITPVLILFLLHLGTICFSIWTTVSRLNRLPVPGSSKTLSTQALSAYYFDFSLGFSTSIAIPSEFAPLMARNGFDRTSIQRKHFKRILDRLYGDRLASIPGRIRADARTGALVYLILLIYIPFATIKARSYTRSTFLRGARYTPRSIMKTVLIETARRESGPEFRSDHIFIGDLPLPIKAEQKHLLILGSTGTGKSVLINQIIAQLTIRQSIRPHRLVIYDVKGEYISKHYRENDIIFYPFDQRSTTWSFFNEIRSYQDFDMVAHALFQAPETDKDVYWYDSAGQVFKSGLMCLARAGKRNNRDIIEFFNREAAKIKDDFIRYLPLADRGAIKHIDKSESHQAASILSILQSRINFFRYLIDQDGPFSFRDYVRNEQENRNLFILNIKQNDLIFKALMTFVVDIMIREVLSLEERSASQTAMFSIIIDEFGSLQKLSAIFDFLTISRSKGGSLIVANQDLGSVIHVYGEAQKSTFFNNFNNSVTFKLNDPQTAEYISKAVGDKEVIKVMDSHQMSPEAMGDRLSLNAQEKLEHVLLPSEFLHLREFQAYIKIADQGLTKVEIPRRFISARYPPYSERDLSIQTLLPPTEQMVASNTPDNHA